MSSVSCIIANLFALNHQMSLIYCVHGDQFLGLELFQPQFHCSSQALGYGVKALSDSPRDMIVSLVGIKMITINTTMIKKLFVCQVRKTEHDIKFTEKLLC